MKQEDNNDRLLWEKVAKTVKKKPLHKGRAVSSPPRKRAEPPSKTESRADIPFRKPDKNKGFDRSTETKLRRGELPIEGTIDLHGMTQEKAFSALLRFIAQAIKHEKRTLLIITGKGSVGGGVLKRMLPLWLEDERIAGHVLALTPAQPKDGGGGAFYLRLRKPRR